MGTKHIVPRAEGEGGIGTATLGWGELFITNTSADSSTQGGKLTLTSNDGAAMQDGSRLGVIEFKGAESSSALTIGARIEAICDAAWTATENGTSLKFFTTDADASESLVLTLDSDKLATFAGNVVISGNMTVNGTTTTVNSTVVTIDDPIFSLGGDTAPGSDDNKDRGIEFRYHTGSAAKIGFFGYDDSANAFTFIPDATNSSEVFSGSAGNVVFNNITASKIGKDADNQTLIDFTQSNRIIFNVDDTQTIIFKANGEIEASSLDIEGDVDIAGTLEADAITVNGTTLAEVISDTTGAMFSSNTETGVTVTYQDADNTIDVEINAAQTTITSLLATDIKIGEDDQTKIDFETADTINFYAGNEKQLILTDGALTPGANNILDLGSSSVEFKDAFFDGTVTADAFAGPLTGNVTGNVSGTAATVTGAAQSNITSLGTLTTLTVDNVIINGTTIGHTSDTDLLTLASASLTVAGNITLNVASDSNPRITFDGAAVDDGHFIQVNRSTEAMEFHASDVTVLTLDTSSVSTFAGNIKIPDSGNIGCASDADLLTLASGALTVAGNVGIGDSAFNYYANKLVVKAPDEDGVTFLSSATDAKFYLAFADGTSGHAQELAGMITFDHNNNEMALGGNAGHEHLKIANGGDVTVTDGDLIIGTSGHGISFAATADTGATGASMASETLDDYEEGTFTATILNLTGSNPTVTGAGSSAPENVTGQYVKIGQMVHIQYNSGEINISNLNGGSSAAIGGLPFASASGHTGVITVTHSVNFSAAVNNGFISSGSSLVGLVQDNSTNYVNWVASGDTFVMIGGTYITA